MRLLIVTIALSAAVLFYYLHTYGKVNWLSSAKANTTKGLKKDKHKEIKPDKSPGKNMGENLPYNIIKKWEMPEILKEISGLCYINDNRFACVQDEEGTVFIYNTSQGKIEKEIAFAGPGDYEGVAVAGNFVYVVRSDGHVYEVDINSKAKVKEYNTSLTATQNVEGLCFDPNNNRLLLAIKGKDINSDLYKGIYSFELNTKKFIDKPVFTIQLDHDVLREQSAKKKNKGIHPTGITIHPKDREIYITDGPGSRLLILDSNGNIKSLFGLGKNDFPQAEGITFDPGGNLYISNEGKKNINGNIISLSPVK